MGDTGREVEVVNYQESRRSGKSDGGSYVESMIRRRRGLSSIK